MPSDFAKHILTVGSYGSKYKIESLQDSYADYLPLNYNTTMITTTAQLRCARLGDIIPLRTLFVHALETDFSYFPPNYIKLVKRQHSLLRLAISLYKSQRIVLLAMFDERVVGYLIGSGHPDGVGEIYWLYVHPSNRSQ
ncbi:MAG TPA: GNAT family N-acetyltransferase, partial [Candidatus Polarisedimenticolaceae bacterium]|nr:GNAT family N-acetyltransferase [Candidatus Polarisedimenticolaceae bacterium]